MTDSEDHSTWRVVGRIKEGYHVLAGKRWLRVDSVDRLPHGQIMLTVHGADPVTVDAGGFLWSRDPAEQFYAVSALLPTSGRVKPRGPMATLYGGSRPTPIPELHHENRVSRRLK